MSDMFGDFDADAARAERQNRMNPPEFAPGQSDDDDFFNDDLFGSDSSIDSGMGTQPSMMNPQVGGFNLWSDIRTHKLLSVLRWRRNGNCSSRN